MDNSMAVLIGVAALVPAALAAFAFYRWRQRQRVRGVGRWVKGYLVARFGEAGGVPGRLTINCTDDRQWPVLVAFDDPRTRIRHNLQFACAGPPSSFSLLSEKEDNR
jgi:hypothetical protein